MLQKMEQILLCCVRNQSFHKQKIYCWGMVLGLFRNRGHHICAPCKSYCHVLAAQVANCNSENNHMVPPILIIPHSFSNSRLPMVKTQMCQNWRERKGNQKHLWMKHMKETALNSQQYWGNESLTQVLDQYSGRGTEHMGWWLPSAACSW